MSQKPTMNRNQRTKDYGREPAKYRNQGTTNYKVYIYSKSITNDEFKLYYVQKSRL